MEDAGTVDLRGDVALPLRARADRQGGSAGGPRRGAGPCAPGQRQGSHRRDTRRRRRLRRRRGGADHRRLVAAAGWRRSSSRPWGRSCSTRSRTWSASTTLPARSGSAFITGWYGYVNKDLRMVLGEARARAVLAHLLRRRLAGEVPQGPGAIAVGGARAHRRTPSSIRASPARAATRSGATTPSATRRPARSPSRRSTGSTGRRSSRSSRSPDRGRTEGQAAIGSGCARSRAAVAISEPRPGRIVMLRRRATSARPATGRTS